MHYTKIIFFVLLSFFSSQNTFAQSLSELEPKLAALAKIMVQDTFAPNRRKAAEEFNPLFISALQQKDAFKYRFDSLTNISMQAPLDSSFRMFTWQLVKDPEHYQYFGAIQMKGKKPRVVVLNDKFQEIEEKEFETCTPENWCGGLIYKMKEFQGKGGKQYLIFGYNINKMYERTKFVDVLKYRDGKFTFGAPLFVQKGKETRKRILMTYGADAKARMNFDEQMQMIVFDHLISQKNEITGLTMVPDGDFEGYRLEKGVWQYVEDAVKTTPMDKPMFPNPVLDKRKGRDINGKKVKKR
jgi:hypothetical protein